MSSKVEESPISYLSGSSRLGGCFDLDRARSVSNSVSHGVNITYMAQIHRQPAEQRSYKPYSHIQRVQQADL